MCESETFSLSSHVSNVNFAIVLFKPLPSELDQEDSQFRSLFEKLAGDVSEGQVYHLDKPQSMVDESWWFLGVHMVSRWKLGLPQSIELSL